MKKVALITGASSGIGKELAHIHAQNSGDLVLVARREKELEDLKKELEAKYSIKVVNIVKDLSESGAAKLVYDEIEAQGIEVEYLINNAGFGLRGKFHELSWERQAQMLNLNMTTLTELTYLFLPNMIKRDSGKILNTSSTVAFLAGPLQAIYHATKAYVTFFSNALAEELHDTNITVTTLMPGATETEFAKTSGMDKTKLFAKTFSANKVAQDGYNAMIDGKLDVVSGISCMQKIVISLIPFIPKKMLLKNIRKMQEV